MASERRVLTAPLFLDCSGRPVLASCKMQPAVGRVYEETTGRSTRWDWEPKALALLVLPSGATSVAGASTRAPLPCRRA